MCAAMLLQSYLTCCDTMDPVQPDRLLFPEDSPGKNTGVDCHALLQGIFPTQFNYIFNLCMLSRFSCVLLSVTTWTVHQAPLSTGFSRQEHWNEPGIEPMSLKSPALTGRFFTTSITWEANSSRLWPSGKPISDLFNSQSFLIFI